jgi:hypothetical protein
LIAVLASAEQQHYTLHSWQVGRKDGVRHDALDLRCYRSHYKFRLPDWPNCDYRLRLGKVLSGEYGIVGSDIRHNHTLVEHRSSTTKVPVPSIPVAAFQSQSKFPRRATRPVVEQETKDVREGKMQEDEDTGEEDDSDDDSVNSKANGRADSDDVDGDAATSLNYASSSSRGQIKGKQKEHVPSVPSFVKFNTLKEEFKQKCGVSSTFPYCGCIPNSTTRPE